MSINQQTITDLIKSRGRGDPPSAMGEVFVVPLVRVMQYLDTKIQFSRIEQTLDVIAATLEDSDELDNLALQLDEERVTIENRLRGAIDDTAANFGLVRRSAASSRGTVLVFRASPVVNPITIPAGKKFFAPTLEQDYAASETVQITAMNFDDDLNKYVFAVPVTSVEAGVATIASIGQISQIQESIPDIEGVTNTEPVTGGRDEESDRSLIARTKTALSASNIGTKSGYRLLLLDLDNIKDASVVGAGDVLMTRDAGDGGSVDIYIADAIPVQTSEVATLGVNLVDLSGVGTGPWIFTPSRQPLIDDISLVTPTAVAIQKDQTAFAGSIQAKDAIEFSSNVDTQTITYFVNDNVNETQVYIDDPSRKILGADILIKEAVTVPVNIIFKISVLPGFAKSVVQAEVQSAVVQFLSALGIGQSLEQSDIVKVAVNIPGVNRIDLPMTRFDRGTVPEQLNIIEAEANEILREGSVVVNI
jgi:uncharacterized phage protein gp47/JayE